jgi:Holliday junction resolvase RusA-like endonuclease
MSAATLAFVIPGPMRGKGRPRFVRATGRAYTPDTTMNAEAWVKHCASQAGATPIDGPVALHMDIMVGIPPSWTKKKRAAALSGEVRPTQKPDLDNVVKLVGDALNGIAWNDDKQIVEIKISRRYAEIERSLVTISAVGEP